MCCFGFRVFVLIFSTILSFILHKIYPQIPVVVYYLLIVSIITFIIFGLFFKGYLPSFVKQAAMHYFSAIGGFFGGFLALLAFKKLGADKFSITEYIIFAFWLIVVFLILLKFDSLVEFFGVFFESA